MASHPRRAWVAALAVATVAGLAAFAVRGGSAAADTATAAGAQQTLTVSGTGTATATPDVAHVVLGVTAQAATAAQALGDDSTQMQAVVAAVEGQGVAAADLRTVGLSLSPRYTPGGPGKPSQIDGFQAFNSVEVTLHDTGRVGAVIDAALAAGANQVGGVSFTAAQPQAAYASAYQAAMADARSAAQALAAAAGLQLGAIRSITASTGGCCVVPYAAAAASVAAAPPVFGGQQAVSVTLQVVYDVGP